MPHRLDRQQLPRLVGARLQKILPSSKVFHPSPLLLQGHLTALGINKDHFLFQTFSNLKWAVPQTGFIGLTAKQMQGLITQHMILPSVHWDTRTIMRMECMQSSCVPPPPFPEQALVPLFFPAILFLAEV